MRQIFPLLIFALFAFSARTFAQCSLPKPGNVKVSSYNSCSATVTWNSVAGAAYYQVKYRKNTSDWTIIPDHLSTLTYTFTGLQPGTSYTFAVASFCSNGSNSSYKQVKKTTTLCSVPLSLNVTNAVGTTATLGWTPECGSTVFNVRYKISTSNIWIKIPGITSSSYLIAGLVPLLSYDFAVQGVCGADTSKWSVKKSFSTTVATQPIVKPNFLIIVLDDGRYDSYQPTGGPSWFQSPSINRIANEGANFTYAFPTTSQCAPSRVSIYTGLYAHHHGALDNSTRMYDGLPLVQQILKDSGYYTGFVGKYGQLQGQPVGFDFSVQSEGNIYTDATFYINNGQGITIPGHITDIYQDYALQFLDSVPANQHFALMFFTRVPHGPTIPRPEDLALYNTDTMPFPTNFSKYTNNFPSYLYGTHNWAFTAEKTDSMRRIEFQCLAGVEENVSAFFSWLDQRGLTDSTMIIFTSDNGYLKGEHKLEAKQIMQEESIRVPLFIRYPAWFAPNTVYNDKMAANIDIAPTILDAAGIPNTYNMDGISLKKLVDNTIQKTYFFYQYAGELGAPTIRGIRSLQYKYVKHYCNTITAEFYDLVNDPKENTNLINNSSYSSLINIYKGKLDSMRTAVGDYNPSNKSCFLSSPQFTKEGDEDSEHESVNDRILRLWPTPASDYFLVSFNEAGKAEDISVRVTDIIGKVVYSKQILNTDVLNTVITCDDWVPGLYLVNLQKGDQSYSEKVIVNR